MMVLIAILSLFFKLSITIYFLLLKRILEMEITSAAALFGKEDFDIKVPKSYVLIYSFV